MEDHREEMHKRIERVLGPYRFDRNSEDYVHWLRLGHLVLESWAHSRANLLSRVVNAEPQDVPRIALDALAAQFDLAGSLIAATTTGYTTLAERETLLEQCADRAIDWFKGQMSQQALWLRESVSISEAKLRLQQRVAHWTAHAMRIAREVNDAQSAAAAVGKPQSLEPTPPPRLINRAKWLQDLLHSRGWTTHDVERNGGPNWRTVRNILEGKNVRPTVLEKLVQTLSLKNSRVKLSDVPTD